MMITAKRILKIYESWLKSVVLFGETVHIYENPDSSDLIKLNKESKLKKFRFIADDKEHKIYVWDAELAIHYEILEKLHLRIDQGDRPHISLGSCKMSGGKLVIDMSAYTFYKASHYDKSDWIKKYIKF